MTGKKITGIVLLIVGVVILILSITADFITIGPLGSSPGFGLQQTIGTAIGVIIAAVGSFLIVQK
jgi:hypothetical protein